MTLPVSLPITFAALTAPTLPELDQNFSALANALNALATQSAAGAITIAAPSSGTALTIMAASGAQALNLQGAAGAGNAAACTIGLIDGNPGNQQWYITSGLFAAGHFGISVAGASLAAFDIAPSGAVAIAPPSINTVALTISPASGGYGLEINAPTTASLSFGALIAAGTTASDITLLIQNALQTLAYFKIFGDGGIIVGNPNGGDKGIGTINVAAGLYVNGVAVTVP